MFKQAELLQEMAGLRKFASKLAQNAAEADDLLQATLLRALEKKHLFQTDTDLFKWTSKIMFNLFVTDYRRKQRFETQYDPESYIISQSINASQDVQMELADVERAMAELSDDHRDILVMVGAQGMSYQEVADALKVPVGTVRSRLSRAREQLQHALDTVRVNPVSEDHYGYARAA